eukprot:scaffold16134_cov32-Tisochrysis_lutea.AAC.3
MGRGATVISIAATRHITDVSLSTIVLFGLSKTTRCSANMQPVDDDVKDLGDPHISPCISSTK